MVLVRASQPQTAKISGRLTLAGHHLVVMGLTVDGGRIDVTGTANRVTRNLFLTSGGVAIRGPANRVDHNEYFTPGGNGIDIALQLSANDRPLSRDNLLTSNLFHTRTQHGEGDDGEDESRRPSVAIYLGQFSARRGRDAMLAYGRTGTVVQNNLFLDYGRRRSVHIKSLGNLVMGNTVVNTGGSRLRAQLTVRSGQFNELVANWLVGRTTLRIFEEHNRAIGNVLLDGAELLVMGGGGEMTAFGGPQMREAVDTLLVGNRGPLRIGATYATRNNKTPARATTVELHEGLIEYLLETETIVRVAANGPVPGAAPLTPEDVGLRAVDARCSSP